jgi:hypothetical protein
MKLRVLSYRAAAVVLGSSLLSLPSVWGATVTLRPIADTSIFSAYPTFNFGGGSSFTAGGRPAGHGGGATRALMLFNIAGNIPAGSIIDSATLRLTVTTAHSQPFNSTFDLDRLTASWGEGAGADRGGRPAGPNESTWNNRFGTSGSPWSMPGGDYISTPSDTDFITGVGSYTFSSTPGLVADIQSWLDNPAGNFGWLLRSESESIPYSIRRFASRNDSTHYPLLTVQYTVVPEPGALSFLAIGLSALAWPRRSNARPGALNGAPGKSADAVNNED